MLMEKVSTVRSIVLDGDDITFATDGRLESIWRKGLHHGQKC